MSMVKCPDCQRLGFHNRESCPHCHRVFSPGELKAKLAAEDRRFNRKVNTIFFALFFILMIVLVVAILRPQT